jgi:hypothetical protein
VVALRQLADDEALRQRLGLAATGSVEGCAHMSRVRSKQGSCLSALLRWTLVYRHFRPSPMVQMADGAPRREQRRRCSRRRGEMPLREALSTAVDDARAAGGASAYSTAGPSPGGAKRISMTGLYARVLTTTYGTRS